MFRNFLLASSLATHFGTYAAEIAVWPIVSIGLVLAEVGVLVADAIIWCIRRRRVSREIA